VQTPEKKIEAVASALCKSGEEGVKSDEGREKRFPNKRKTA